MQRGVPNRLFRVKKEALSGLGDLVFRINGAVAQLLFGCSLRAEEVVSTEFVLTFLLRVQCYRGTQISDVA